MGDEPDPAELWPTTQLQPPGEAPADSSLLRDFGDYQLITEIGRGGMGSVFEARQRSLQRLVAVKLIRGGQFARPEDIARFRTEAAAMARLRHPGIVAIHEVGERNGHHFYSMDLVPGRSLAAALREGPFAPRRAAGCVHAIACAIAHAHEQGVLHRDLKPSNILLAPDDSAHVTDFGLAKLRQAETDRTLSGTVLGSPNYMPPEQADGRRGEFTPESDVYSLGAILYECLTGRPPFSAATPLETMKLVLEQEPVPPHRLNATIPSDLQTIALKCLSKAPSARYPTAADLAADLQRYLKGEPIMARPAGTLRRLVRWSRRKPAWAGLALLAVLVPLLVAGLRIRSERRIRLERDVARVQTRLAEANAATTRLNLYAADLFVAMGAVTDGNYSLAQDLLSRHVPPPSGSTAVLPDLRGFEWHYLWNRCRGDQVKILSGAPHPIRAMAINPAGDQIAVGGQDFVWVFELDTGRSRPLLPRVAPAWLEPSTARQLIEQITTSPPRRDQMGDERWSPTPGQFSQMVNPDRPDLVTSLSYSADGRWLASASCNSMRAARVWDSTSGEIRFALPTVHGHAQFRPGTSILGVGSLAPDYDGRNGCVKLYDLITRQERHLLPAAGGRLGFSGDGQWLATGGRQRDTATGPIHELDVWRLDPLEKVRTVAGGNCAQVGLSQDGSWLAAAYFNRPGVDVWRVADGLQLPRLGGDLADVRALSFSPDRKWLATGGDDEVIRLWSIPGGVLTKTFRGHSGGIAGLAFHPQKPLLISASRDQTVRLWTIHGELSATPTSRIYPEESRLLTSFDGSCHSVVSPGFRGDSYRRPLIWNTRSNSDPVSTPEVPGFITVCGLSRDGGDVSYLRSGSTGDLRLETARTKDGRVSRTVTLDGQFLQVEFASLSRTGTWIALGSATGEIGVWNASTGQKRWQRRPPALLEDEAPRVLAVLALEFSHDDQLLGVVDQSPDFLVYSTETGELRTQIAQPPIRVRNDLISGGDIAQAALSPVAPIVALADGSLATIRLHNLETGARLSVLRGHLAPVVSLAFSPDGKTLVSVARDRTARLWQVATGRPLGTIAAGELRALAAFSGDGQTLILNGLPPFRAPQ